MRNHGKQMRSSLQAATNTISLKLSILRGEFYAGDQPTEGQRNTLFNLCNIYWNQPLFLSIFSISSEVTCDAIIREWISYIGWNNIRIGSSAFLMSAFNFGCKRLFSVSFFSIPDEKRYWLLTQGFKNCNANNALENHEYVGTCFTCTTRNKYVW